MIFRVYFLIVLLISILKLGRTEIGPTKQQIESANQRYFQWRDVICGAYFDQWNAYPPTFIRELIPNALHVSPWHEWTTDSYVFIGYHGTKDLAAASITRHGFQLKGKLSSWYGFGAYVTPALGVARTRANNYTTLLKYEAAGEPDHEDARICYVFAPKFMMDSLIFCVRDDRAAVPTTTELTYPPPVVDGRTDVTVKHSTIYLNGQSKLPWTITYPPETLGHLKFVCIPSMPADELPVVFPFSYPDRLSAMDPLQLRTLNLKDPLPRSFIY